jgi:hypothetical protein
VCRCVKFIQEKYDRILLPLYTVNHFVVVDMDLVRPHVKVWDGMCQKGEGARWHHPFLDSFREAMYGPRWRQVPMVVERDAKDPFQAQCTSCCGPMAALTLAYLVKGVEPMGYNHKDDAIMRSWMLASIAQLKLAALPEQRIESE